MAGYFSEAIYQICMIDKGQDSPRLSLLESRIKKLGIGIGEPEGKARKPRFTLLIENAFYAHDPLKARVIFAFKELGYDRAAEAMVKLLKDGNDADQWKHLRSNNVDQTISHIMRDYCINYNTCDAEVVRILVSIIVHAIYNTEDDLRVLNCIGNKLVQTASLLRSNEELFRLPYTPDPAFDALPSRLAKCHDLAKRLLTLPINSALRMAFYIGMDCYRMIRRVRLFLEKSDIENIDPVALERFISKDEDDYGFRYPDYDAFIVSDCPNDTPPPQPADIPVVVRRNARRNARPKGHPYFG